VTDRTNPTSQDWYFTFDARFVPPSEVTAVLHELKAKPPKLVILQTESEFDWARSHRPPYVLNYQDSVLQPIYQYLIDNYTTVVVVDDIHVLVPSSP